MKNSTKTARRLFEVADTQQGFFTAKQAKEAGYFEESFSYHLKAGNWVRERRGIYRLARYPLASRPDLMLWYLWSRNRREEPQGVYSHETALALYDLGDINPRRLHMTVPKGFRRNSAIPGILVLHFDDIPPGEIRHMHAVAVTGPARSIVDVLREGNMSDDAVRLAVSEALARGLITLGECEALRSNGDVPGHILKGLLR